MSKEWLVLILFSQAIPDKFRVLLIVLYCYENLLREISNRLRGFVWSTYLVHIFGDTRLIVAAFHTRVEVTNGLWRVRQGCLRLPIKYRALSH